ncbi:PIN domain-containing protein [Microcoleus sp. FACHB-SPT15]|nr:PIN domain-containing protein [Microcoleus sp. FACHB-SPT15]
MGNSNKCFNQFTKAIALRDFEDAVQLACAMASRLDAIISRNAQDESG